MSSGDITGPGEPGRSDDDGVRERIKDTVTGLPGAAKAAAGNVADAASGVAGKAQEAAGKAQEKAQEAAGKAQEKAQEAAGKAQELATADETPRRASAGAFVLIGAAAAIVWALRRRARNRSPWRRTVREAKATAKKTRGRAEQQAKTTVATAKRQAKAARSRARSWR